MNAPIVGRLTLAAARAAGIGMANAYPHQIDAAGIERSERCV